MSSCMFVFFALVSTFASGYAGKVAPVKSASNKYTAVPISYHGGPTMSCSIPVYYIWYGSFSAFDKNLIKNYTSYLGVSQWWNIVQEYNTGSVSYGGYTNVAITSTLLTSANVQKVIQNAISSGSIGDKTGNSRSIYVLLTDKTVDQSDSGANQGFCAQYCGWHDHMIFNNKDIKYAWIGSPQRCVNQGFGNDCSALQTSGSDAPNGNYEIDSMISVISHELAETASDSDLNAWYDAGGNENSDKCAWQFGTTHTGTSTNHNGKWNEIIGTRKYYIQMQWGLVPNQGCYN